jgi:PKD domain
MSGLRAVGRLTGVLACALALPALSASVVQAKPEPHPHVGKLPGFPVIRGVVPVLGTKAAIAAHEKLVNQAFAAVRARQEKGLTGHTEPNEKFLSECEGEAFFLATQDVCYRGGPVLRDPTIHLIFWQGPVAEPNVELFPPHYVEIVARYFEDVAHDNGRQTNVFAVDPQYFDKNAKEELVAGEYALSFDKSVDLTVDNAAFPKHLTGGCTDESAKGPCLLDSDIQAEVEKVAGSTPKGLKDIYVVLTPKGVGGCFEAGSGVCAYQQYCAYHGDFGGDGHTSGDQTLYVDLPYLGEAPGCDFGVHPNEVVSKQEENEGKDHGADAVIDTASHEVNEAITDPIGSQCASGATKASECERNAWTDVIGQEIGDKCLPPESTVLGTYGEPLGELLIGRPASLYNQLINSDHYWTQREWSNEAGLFEGGCVQRAIGSLFTVSAGAQATVALTLDGSPSGAAGDPATYWIWNFGEGEQVGTASATISHTFAQAGEHEVGLTAFDGYGNAEATVETVNVGPAPVHPPPPPPPAPPAPLIIKEATPPVHLTSEQLAAQLGIPANGKKLSGNGGISFGHAQCPPACSVGLRLYEKVPSTSHKRHTIKLVPIGSLHLTIAAKGSAALVVQLNAKGRALLHKNYSIPCKLVVSVEGQEGASWQIERSLTLTNTGQTAGRPRH